MPMADGHDVATPVSGKGWVWLDLDDTLYDFAANSEESLREMYATCGLDRYWPCQDAWLDHYHRINAELWNLYSRGQCTRDHLRHERFYRPLTEAGCPETDAHEMAVRFDPLYLGMLGVRGRTVDGAIELLERLRGHYYIGVLSNGFREVQYAKMKSAGIEPYVACVVLSDELDVNKPDPRIFRYAEQKADTEAHSCLLVGDNPDTDIAGALRAGWDAVWLNPASGAAEETLEALGLKATAGAEVCRVDSLGQICAADGRKFGKIGLNIKKSR